jgi:hypothetical protein
MIWTLLWLLLAAPYKAQGAASLSKRKLGSRSFGLRKRKDGGPA